MVSMQKIKFWQTDEEVGENLLKIGKQTKDNKTTSSMFTEF